MGDAIGALVDERHGDETELQIALESTPSSASSVSIAHVF
jgi:hypothetical protein